MRDGITIPNITPGHEMKDPITGATGGFQPERNTTFKKFSTRTMRPVVDFDKCVKCTLCWLQCPDSCFDVTPDQTYDVNAEACCGCGVCAAVCPVDACITMVNEAAFTDHKSQWERYKTDKQEYASWLKQVTAAARPVARVPVPRPISGTDREARAGGEGERQSNGRGRNGGPAPPRWSRRR